MLSIFVTILLGILGPAEQNKTQDLSEHWSIDREVVTSGGCLTVMLDDVGSALRGLTLQIDDRKPVNFLGRAGSTIQRHIASKIPGHLAPVSITTTFVLVSHDFQNPEGVELLADEPDTYRLVPIFNEPGRVRLTLRAGDRSLGTKVVTVVPGSVHSEPAVDLLFPEFTGDQGPGRGRIIALLGSADHGPNASRDGPNLLEFKRELDILRGHPDWVEIFEMLVTQLEARVELSQLRRAIETGEIEVDAKRGPPPPADGVTEALKAVVSSPFAKAIQDGVRGTIAQRAFIWRKAHRDK